MATPARKTTPKVTRLKNIQAERVDGVDGPANGFPVLMMKAVNAQGGIDEKPDIAGAQGVIVDLFKLIASEAAEGATGAFSEIWDIQLLTEALCAMKCFLSMEQMGDEDDGETAYKSLGLSKAQAESFAGYVLKKKHSAENRRSLASEGKALPDGSYPIEDEEDLHNAAILARSGHGDVAAAKRLIAKRAKELGVANPLAASATKELTMPEDTAGQVETPEDGVSKTTETSEPTEAPVDEPEIDSAITAAIAKAVQPIEEANQELRDELAKLKATPIPGGPALTAPAGARAVAAKSEKLVKAAQYRRTAERVSDREIKKQYLAMAAALEAEAA